MMMSVATKSAVTARLAARRVVPNKRLVAAFRRALRDFIKTIGADAKTWKTPCSILLTGSLSGHDYDHLSDVDLTIVVRREHHIPVLLGEYQRHLSRIGTVLAWYSAEHLGKPNLWITLIQIGQLVIKVDAEFTTKGNITSTAAAKFVHNGLGLNGKDVPSGAPTANRQNVTVRDDVAVGWLWYTFTKVLRGELFQSAGAIDYTRKNYILRLVGQVENVQLEDYRRLEKRVSKTMLKELEATYPASLDERELCRALFSEAKLILLLLNKSGRVELAQRVQVMIQLMEGLAKELLPEG